MKPQSLRESLSLGAVFAALGVMLCACEQASDTPALPGAQAFSIDAPAVAHPVHVRPGEAVTVSGVLEGADHCEVVAAYGWPGSPTVRSGPDAGRFLVRVSAPSDLPGVYTLWIELQCDGRLHARFARDVVVVRIAPVSDVPVARVVVSDGPGGLPVESVAAAINRQLDKWLAVNVRGQALLDAEAHPRGTLNRARELFLDDWVQALRLDSVRDALGVRPGILDRAELQLPQTMRVAEAVWGEGTAVSLSSLDVTLHDASATIAATVDVAFEVEVGTLSYDARPALSATSIPVVLRLDTSRYPEVRVSELAFAETFCPAVSSGAGLSVCNLTATPVLRRVEPGLTQAFESLLAQAIERLELGGSVATLLRRWLPEHPALDESLRGSGLRLASVRLEPGRLVADITADATWLREPATSSVGVPRDGPGLQVAVSTALLNRLLQSWSVDQPGLLASAELRDTFDGLLAPTYAELHPDPRLELSLRWGGDRLTVVAVGGCPLRLRVWPDACVRFVAARSLGSPFAAPGVPDGSGQAAPAPELRVATEFVDPGVPSDARRAGIDLAQSLLRAVYDPTDARARDVSALHESLSASGAVPRLPTAIHTADGVWELDAVSARPDSRAVHLQGRFVRGSDRREGQ